MALAEIVDTLESIPETARGAYVKDEATGKFKLDFDVSGLKSALASERNLNKVAKDKVAAWERLGVSPEEIETRLEAERVKAEDALKKAGKFDEVLATHLGKAKQERDEAVNTATKQREAALGVARNAVVRTELATALAKAKATPEGLMALPKLIGDRVKIEFDDAGDAKATIFDVDGKTPMVGSGPGGLATFDDLVKETSKTFSSLFEGTGGGGGTPPKGGGGSAGKTMLRTDFDTLSAVDKMAKMKAGVVLVD